MAVNNERNQLLGMHVGANRLSVGRWDGDEPVVYKNRYGEDIEPCCIFLGPDGEVRVGTEAVRGGLVKPERSVSGRRLLEAFNNSDPLVAAAGIIKDPEELYQDILAQIYNEVASQIPPGWFGCRGLVVTVPGWFTLEARHKVSMSAERLGLSFRETIQEHVAASLPHYVKLCHNGHSCRDLLVVCELEDDAVSATVIDWQLSTERCVAEVLAHNYSKQVGVGDLDERLASSFVQRSGVNMAEIDPRDRRINEAQMKGAAQEARKNLCFVQSYYVCILLYMDRDGARAHRFFEFEISRDQYNDLVRDQISQIVNTVLQAAAQAGISGRDLSASMLVGEYTQIALLRQMLEEAIGGGKALVGYDSRLCFVQGAAIYAACLDGIKVFGRPLEIIDRTESTTMDIAVNQPKVNVTCPGCGHSYRNVKREQVGKVGRCKKCGHKFRVDLMPDERKPAHDSDQKATILSAQTQARFGAAETVAASPQPNKDLSSKQAPPRTPAATVYAKAPADSASLRKAEHDVEADWNIGDVILDLYEVTGILGEGGMGKVYKVKHLGWDTELAVKCCRKEYLASAGGIEDFAREAETWVNLGNHPNIVSCFYVRTLGDIPRVFAEYVEGGSLSDWIRTRKLYEGDSDEVLATILDIGIQTAWGLHYAHEKGLVHQDMKPGNVMMTPDGVAKIADFGLARARGAAVTTETARAAGKTMVVDAAGSYTPEYASPEQLAGAPLTRRADIWCWAASVVEMFSGGLRWIVGIAVSEFLKKNLANWGGLDNAGPRPPGAVARILKKCFEMEPGDRPGSLVEIVTVFRDEYQQIMRKVYPRLEPTVQSQDADSLNNRALSLFDLGKSEDAVKLWDEALKIDPLHPLTIYNRGLTQWKLGFQGIHCLLRRLKEVGDLNHDYYMPHLLSARMHMELGDYESASGLLSAIASRGVQVPEVDYLLSIADGHEPLSYRLREHSEAFRYLADHLGNSSVCLSRDGRFALTGGSSLKLWEVRTGKCVRTFEGQTGQIISVCLSRDGRFALTGGSSLKLWEVRTGKCVRTFEVQTGQIISVCLSRDGRFAVSRSVYCGEVGYVSDHIYESLAFWDIGSGACKRTFQGEIVSHESDTVKPSDILSHMCSIGRWHCSALCVSQDGRFALTGGSALRLWEVSTGNCIRTFTRSERSISCVGISGDGRFALSYSDIAAMEFWDITTGDRIRTFETRGGYPITMCLSYEGRFAMSGWSDRTAVLWDTATGECLRTFGRVSEESIITWDFDDEIESPEEEFVSVWSPHFAAWPNVWAVSIRGLTTSVWSIDSTAPVLAAPTLVSKTLSDDRAISAAERCRREIMEATYVLEDGDALQAAGLIRKVRSNPRFANHPEALAVWRNLTARLPAKSFSSGWTKHVMDGHTAKIDSVYLSHDGRLALSGSQDNTMRLWNVAEQTCTQTFLGHSDPVVSVCLSRDASLALSGSWDKTLRLWDVSSGTCIRTFRGHTAQVSAVALSADGRFALSGCHDNTMRLWDISTGNCIRHFEGHTSWLACIVLSADSHFALSGSCDKTAKLWDISTGRCVKTFAGHARTVASVGLNIDGSVAMTATKDDQFRLWDTTTERCTEAYTSSNLNCVCLSYDGRFALTGNENGSVEVWDLGSGECVRALEISGNANSVSLSYDKTCALSAGSEGSIAVWTFDWDLEDRYPENWVDGAQPYLEAFLTQHTPYAGTLPEGREPSEEEITLALTRRGRPSWTEEDFNDFVYSLGCAGYGWLRPEGVRRRLEEMAENWQGPQKLLD